MPPAAAGGVPLAQRNPTDAVVQLASLLDLWLAQGSPRDAFQLPTQSSSGSAGYTMTAALGSQLTNLGSCIPNKQMVAMAGTQMATLDGHFASITALPATLDQTDLITLDSAELARNGVVSYAPTYPLWSDDAQKMRYVRVPHGQSIKFDKAAQKFTIPDNTRFYKTFLKRVIDTAGNVTYRKIETRVIVARADTTNSDGSAAQHALFGTYVWNEDESQATLLTDPLRDGKPFADRIFSFITDEKSAADRRQEAGQPAIGAGKRRPDPALRAARVRTVRPVSHGQPQRRFHPGVHAAAGGAARDRRRGNVRADRRRRGDAASAAASTTA